MTLADGGQVVLLSEATDELVRDDLARRPELVDLGEHRLRDLARPEARVSARAPGPRPRLPAAARRWTPFRATCRCSSRSFVGREDEITAIAHAIDAVRMVTITGVGGVGKTRLAVQSRRRRAPDFSPTVPWICELAAANDSESFPPGRRPGPGAPWAGLAIARTPSPSSSRTRTSCSCSTTASTSSTRSGSSSYQVDSTALRQRAHAGNEPRGLGVNGEQVWPAPVIDGGRTSNDPDELMSYDAVRLFVECADAVRPAFRPRCR